MLRIDLQFEPLALEQSPPETLTSVVSAADGNICSNQPCFSNNVNLATPRQADQR